MVRWSIHHCLPESTCPLSGGPRGWGKGFLPRQILRNGRELVAQGWAQSAHARDRDGRPVHPWSADARSWSVLGAIVCGDETHRGRVPIGRLAEAVILFASTMNTSSLNDWNDKSERTRADVLAAFDAAIASTMQRGEGLVRHSSA